MKQATFTETIKAVCMSFDHFLSVYDALWDWLQLYDHTLFFPQTSPDCWYSLNEQVFNILLWWFRGWPPVLLLKIHFKDRIINFLMTSITPILMLYNHLPYYYSSSLGYDRDLRKQVSAKFWCSTWATKLTIFFFFRGWVGWKWSFNFVCSKLSFL